MRGLVSVKAKDRVQQIGAIISIIGLFMLCQPITVVLYNYGFQVLGIGGIFLIFPGFLPSKGGG